MRRRFDLVMTALALATAIWMAYQMIRAFVLALTFAAVTVQ